MLLAVAHLATACGTAATPLPSTVATSPSTPLASTTSYSRAFGIDYAHTEAYLEQGEQSHIADPSQLDRLRSDEQSPTHLADLTEAVDSLASQLDFQAITYPEYTFRRFDG